MNKFTLTLIIAFASAFIFGVCAKPQQKFFISHFEHPSLGPYRTLLRNVYKELSIKVEFVSMANTRGLIALNDGLVDADVLRMEISQEKYPNILIVKPALTYSDVYLICAQQIECDRSVLSQSATNIYASKRQVEILKKHFMSNTKANFVEFELYATLLSLLQHQRVNYVIYGWGRDSKIPEGIENFNYVKLFHIPVYHVINRDHADKKEAISLAINKQLALDKPQ